MDVVEADIAFSSLHTPDVRPVKTDSMGKFLL